MFTQTLPRPSYSSIFSTVRCWLAALALIPWTVSAGNYFQGVSPASLPWPGGIVPYKFDTNYPVTAIESNTILAGLNEWQLAANVKFIPRTSQVTYVLLQYTNDGSGTGYYLSGSPTTNAFMMLHGLARGLICHEAGHLFGLQHEHQRTDRNNYITVNLANVFGGTNGEGLSAFVIDSNSTAFSAYDLQSVMHYAPDDFTNGLGDALDPLPEYEKYYHKIGNLALSIEDRATVSNLYGAPVIPLSNIVTNTADGGAGSLRAALYYANDHPGTTIHFNIPNTDTHYSNGVYTIYLIGELPPLVSAGTIIDGTTESGFAGKPIIAVDGSQVSPAAGGVSGLHLYGTNCVVRALACDNFSYSGIQLFCSDAVSNQVQGCYVGLKPDGTNAASDTSGVVFQFGAHNNFIGGTNAAQRNVISGNQYYGVLINDTNTDANVILGNYIGLNAAGTAAVPNYYSGVGVYFDQRNTVIGGTNAGAGNVISGNGQYGIYIDGTNNTGAIVQGNYLGTDATGNNMVSNVIAGVIVIDYAHNVTIGGTSAAARNVISGNGTVGIYLLGPGCSNNVVQGNYVGVNAAGTAALGNTNGNYLVGGTTATLVGGTNAGAGNLFSGNGQYGVFISDQGTSNNVVEGNYVGTDFTGMHVVPNGKNAYYGGFGIGVLSGANNNLIGGTNASARNLIAGNLTYGIAVISAATNFIEGNFIGTDVTGTNALGNGSGVGIYFGATGTILGGTGPGMANIISGNTNYGCFIDTPGTTGNFVEGNFIGTDINGKKSVPNGFAGAAIFGAATNNVIGGTVAGAGNLVSGNGTYGVFISDPGTDGNYVQGNFIGTDITGTNARVNGFYGGANVVVQSGAVGNFIGGVTAGAVNVIAFSAAGPGVLLYNPTTTNNSFRGNSIFGNAALGIDLNADGVTPNHIGVLAGPNDFQNYPVITNTFGFEGSTIVLGKFNSLASKTYFIDVYRNPSADATGYGQGKFYLGTVSVTTDGSGNASFAFTNTAGNYAGQYFATTATSAGGDTSEFSADLLASNAPAPSVQLTGPFAWRTNGFIFSLTLVTNFSYHIQATTNLTGNPVPWVNLTNFTAASVSLLFTDRTATNFRTRFYRATSP